MESDKGGIRLGTMKNKEVYPVGTRVRFAHEKINVREGVVVEHTEDGKRMYVLWDGNKYPVSLWPVEVKEVK